MRTIEEVENDTDVFNELIEHNENLKERERNRIGIRSFVRTCRTRCHRCHSKLKVLQGSQYCPDCNWDSLEDPSYSRAS